MWELPLLLDGLKKKKNEYITQISTSGNSKFTLRKRMFFTEQQRAENSQRTIKDHVKWKLLEINW